ncbi:hypothetical protein HWV62_1202 [Athelia sp. TMB]|nr:hypothetical protein HWV62_1202 [Athelia sp. TMB]
MPPTPLTVRTASGASLKDDDLFSWKSYFMRCWASTHHSNVERYLPQSWKPFFRVLIVYKMRLGRWLERLVYPNRKRKALLIGIKKSAGEVELSRPHTDVLAMRDLLTTVYGYRENDIVIMLDDGASSDPNMRPTRLNILRAITELIEDAKAGDRFVFHFSGHSTQVINKTGTEDDGMDEAIIPSDSLEIIDNDLKKMLVDPLPVGSHLVAIFDTCHSGSLLDLTHHRCNRPPRPPSGIADKADPPRHLPWTPTQARLSIYQHQVPAAPSPPVVPKPVRSATLPAPSGSAPTKPPVRKRTLSRKTTLEIRAPTLQKPTRISIKTGSSSPGASPQMERYRDFGSPIKRSTVAGMAAILEGGQANEGERQVRWLRDEDGDQLHYLSPERTEHPVLCDGGKLCEAALAAADARFANVIALGACKDGQFTWEDETVGRTMTAVLPNTNPDLLRSEETYKNIDKMHRDWEEYKKRAPTDAAAQAVQQDFSEEWQDPQPSHCLGQAKPMYVSLVFTIYYTL